MSAVFNLKKKVGKSCLVCRRRKVKCDKTKPVCLACVRHQSTMQCDYDINNDNMIIFQVPDINQPASGSRINKTSKKGQATKNTTIESNVTKELDFLKSKLQSLEALLQNPVAQDRNKEELKKSAVPDGCDPNLTRLKEFGEMSFHDDYESIEVKAGRLSFAGPLNFMALARRDPFLSVTIAMIKKERHENYQKAMLKKEHANRKYPDVDYTPEEIANQLIINNMREKDSTHKNCQAKTKMDRDGPISEAGTRELDDEDGEINESDFQYSNTSEYIDQAFKNKLIENEGLDEMCSIVKKGQIAQNPLSVTNLLNDEKKPESSTEAQSKDSPGGVTDRDILIWRKLQTVLSTLQQQEQHQAQLSNQRIPEMLYGHSNVSNSNPELEVLIRVQNVLPSDKLIWLHIDNYFRSPLHGLFPILSEDWFRDTITTLIGERRNVDTKPHITISKRFGFSNIGSLLVVLRLSYLMYPKSLEDCNTEEEVYVLSNPIGTEFIDVAQMCLNLFKMLRKGVLPVLHCALLLRIYRRFSPEEGDIVDGGDTEPFTGLLVQMATSIGLNTDAETSYQLSPYHMYLQAWRKCWYIVYFLDYYEGMNMGNTIMIGEHSFSTKLPTLEMNEKNEYPSFVIDPDLELATSGCFKKNFELSLECRKILRIVMNKRTRTNCREVQATLNQVEVYLHSNYGSDLKDIISQPCHNLGSSVKKCNDFEIYLQTMSTIFMIYYHLFLHIDNCVSNEPDQQHCEVSFFYLKKLAELYAEVEPILILLYCHNESLKDGTNAIEAIFGKNSKLVIVQSCLYFIVRFVQALHTLSSRLLHLKFNYLKDPRKHSMFSDSENLNNIEKIVEAILNMSLEKILHANSITHMLSETYFQAWRMSKGNAYIYSLLSNNENNIFDLNSPLNIEHMKLSSVVHDTGEPRLKDHLNPLNSIPKFNGLLMANLSDFEQILSVLSSVKWNLFSEYINEDLVKKAQAFRNEHNIKRRTKSKKRHPKSKQKVSLKKTYDLENIKAPFIRGQDSSPSEFSKNNSPQSTNSKSDRSLYNVTDKPLAETSNRGLIFDEIDAFWYSTMLRNTNGNTEWNSSLDDSATNPTSRTSAKNILPILSKDSATASPDVPDHKKGDDNNTMVNDQINNGSVGLDELFNNQALLQEHVTQQLQQLTNRQVSFNNTSSRENKSNGNQFSNDGVKGSGLHNSRTSFHNESSAAKQNFSINNFGLLFPGSQAYYGDDMELI